jgi:hypothetical protein
VNQAQHEAADCADAVRAFVRYFESLSAQSLHELDRYYAANARFKDPFNDVTGMAAIRQIFDHMFLATKQPQFVVTRTVCQGSQCFLTWEFRFEFKNFKQGQKQLILGATHLEFSSTGLVTLHRDYWDAAEEMYEKLPVLGGLMRWLKKRVNQ